MVPVFIFLAGLVFSTAVPVPVKKEQQTCPGDFQHTQKCIKRFCNLTITGLRRKRASPVMDKLKKAQKVFDLSVTGNLESKPTEMVKKSRCGIPDVGKYNFFHPSNKWQKNMLTYKFVNYAHGLKPEEVEQTIEMAFKVWSDVVPLTFIKVDEREADITITFAAGGHGDFLPFDGPFGHLAHAYAPGEGIGGDTHFDGDETWTMDSKDVSLFIVAVHEFGHALGLGHSDDPSALMYPLYTFINHDSFKLSDDDIQGIQALYGRK
nr:PREDICTED: collagenase 3-like [Latimeria chalumnae]|eukprot:XP_005998662.2 PREDICTED: collagenase 3-like [Latimeria chalumnae]